MKRIGFEKARSRLGDAFKAHEDLKNSTDWQSFESAWTRLLTALNSVYSILDQSSKGSPRSDRWFADAKKQRKADEVLSYLHHARNVNDHGISEVLRRERGGIGIGGRGQGLYIEHAVIGPRGLEEFRGHSLDGSPIEARYYPERVVLIPVRDRGVEYHTPASFLGQPLDDTSPLGVAGKVLEFMVVLFRDAEELLIDG